MSVKRWDIDSDGGTYEDTAGDYVLYSDYASLADSAALQIHELEVERDRLTKAYVVLHQACTKAMNMPGNVLPMLNSALARAEAARRGE